MAHLHTSQISARLPTRPQRRQLGAASLVVVLMLFFVISLVAAYTSRNLIFEQRTSVNQYRSTMAFETADAGLEWALAMLNGGRIGDNCTVATATATSTSFRQRYLNINTSTGVVTPKLPGAWPSCVWNGTDWTCNCPITESFVTAPIGAGLFPAFSINFSTAGVTRPGVIRIEVNGCVKLVDNCMREFADVLVESEGRSQNTTLVALKSALTTQPAAAITVWGDSNSADIAARNSDLSRGGFTLHAAGRINVTPTNLIGLPGTPAARSMIEEDASLIPHGLALPDLTTAPASTRDRVFASVFNLLPDSYRAQPAAVPLTCAVGGCRQALADLVAANPNRVIWVTGDLTLESVGVGSIGSMAEPASIVVNGDVIVTDPAVSIVGVVYVRGVLAPSASNAWQGGGQITGALLTESGLSAAAAPNVTYDKTVLVTVRRQSGSFVRIPGGWRDYK